MPFPTATIVYQGQSITGSYNRFQVMASGSVVSTGGSAFAVGHISALRDGNGTLFSFPSTSGLFIPPGTNIDFSITSASLSATSAPIMFFQV
jgi:hypothetical protein